MLPGNAAVNMHPQQWETVFSVGSEQKSYLKRRYTSQKRLQNKVLCTIGNFPRRTPVRDLHVAFRLPYVYDYAGNKQKSYKIMKMKMFATLDKENRDTGNIRG
jgi:hypothetical protein